MRLATYEKWIKSNTRRRVISGKCYEFSFRMSLRFPELRLVYGWVKLEIQPGVLWPHWYLLCPAGAIVDPTRAQFGLTRILEYGLWPRVSMEPTGYCKDCCRTLRNFEECERHPDTPITKLGGSR